MNYITLSELARQTGKTRQNLHIHVQRGHLKAKRIGLWWIVSQREAERWIKMYAEKRSRLGFKRKRYKKRIRLEADKVE